MAEKESILCPKCKTLLRPTNFYIKKNGTKTELCKNCLTLHVDNFNPETYVWIIKDLDFPYVESEWMQLRDKALMRANGDARKLKGTSILGKYCSKMRLNQYKNYSWKDTEDLKKFLDERMAERGLSKEKLENRDAILKDKLESGEISQAEYDTLSLTIETVNNNVNPEPEIIETTDGSYQIEDFLIGNNNQYNENNFMSEEELNKDFNLTDEDRQMLALKWGRLYKESEWISMEKDYHAMLNSFDIQDADTKKSLIFLCKSNLKADQSLDCGDIDGFQKLQRVSSDLRKSMKLTAAQRKEEKADFVDCIGTMVNYCEKEGGVIPRYEIEVDYDIVDTVVRDMKDFYRSLVYEDAALGRMIEDYLKNREILDAQKRDKEEAIASGQEFVELTDQDIYNKLQWEEEEKEKDRELLEGGE